MKVRSINSKAYEHTARTVKPSAVVYTLTAMAYKPQHFTSVTAYLSCNATASTAGR